VELMIVVAIIGILAAVAIPAFVKYIRKSKSAEAGGNLGKIVHGAIAYFDVDHATSAGAPLAKCFPGTPGAWFSSNTNYASALPSVGCCAVKCSLDGTAPSKDDWGGNWQALSFSVTDPHYYNYAFSGQCCTNNQCDGTVFTAAAVGDLNCDTVTSLFMRQGSTSAGEIKTSPLYVDPKLEIE
jgi:type IV pilus assembly protein PilA